MDLSSEDLRSSTGQESRSPLFLQGRKKETSPTQETSRADFSWLEKKDKAMITGWVLRNRIRSWISRRCSLTIFSCCRNAKGIVWILSSTHPRWKKNLIGNPR